AKTDSISLGVLASKITTRASRVRAEPSQNKLALFAARHLGAKQLEDKGIGRLANSPDRRLGSLGFQATHASTIHHRLRAVAYGSTAKLGNALAGQAQKDRESGRE